MNEVIMQKLNEIEQRESVRIIMAIESGSRAWGFASPDSDYDVRFVYVRKLEDTLRLEKYRDVIEWQLDDVLDISGWDLQKALRLMHDSNPSIFEWCSSPIIYRNSKAFEELKLLKDEFFSPKKSLYHYWHMANSNYQNYLQGDKVRIKKYFYVLRPLLAAKWVMEEKSQPPMLFSELLTKLPLEQKESVDKLLEMKQVMPEMGIASKIEILDNYIETELLAIKTVADEEAEKKTEWTNLNRFYYDQILGDDGRGYGFQK